MKYSLICLVVFAIACRAVGETPTEWLDEYFSVQRSFEQEQMDYLLSRHADWRDRLKALEQAENADEALHRYLFVYHLAHSPRKLEWEGGDWCLSIEVCNCGKAGAVPTEEFEKLLDERTAAISRLEVVWSDRWLDDMCGGLRDEKRLTRQTFLNRVAYLRTRFLKLVESNPPNRVAGEVSLPGPHTTRRTGPYRAVPMVTIRPAAPADRDR